MTSMKFLTRMWLKKSVNDILRQKLLFFALITLCFLGTSSYLALTMGYTNLEASYEKIYDQTNFADFEYFTYEDIWYNISKISPIVNEFIEMNPEIQSINYRLIVETNYNLTSVQEGKVRRYFADGRVIGINPQLTISNRINDLIIDNGYYFNTSSPSNAILLESHFSQKFNIKKGELLKTGMLNESYDFLVQGIVFSPEYLVVIPSKHDFLPTSVFGVIYLPIERLQEYTNLTGLANNLLVKLTPNTPDSISNALIDNLSTILNYHTNNSFTPPIPKEFQVSNLALHLDLETFEEIALILPIIILSVASVSIYITLGRMIQNQKKNIGIAASLGYFPNDILFHYILFSVLIGGLGTIVGVILGVPGSSVITWVYSYFMRFPQIIEIQIQTHIIIIASLTGVCVSILGGIIPAWNASRMIPREALQISPSVEKGSHSILERFFIINKMGLKLIIPIRNLFRRKKRASATIVAIASAVMILVISLAFIDSVTSGVDRQFNKTSQYDIIVKYEGFKFFDLGVEDDIDIIRGLSGVISVEPVLQLPSIIYIDGKPLEILITAWNNSNPNVHNFYWSSPEDKLAENGSIVICSAIARNYGIHTNDQIDFSYPRIPGVNLAFKAATAIWKNFSSFDLERARNETLTFLSELIAENKERFSFYGETNEIRMKTIPINVSGVSEEIWSSIIYTTTKTMTHLMGIEIFKTELDIDLTPSSQLILKINEPNNLTKLEEIQNSISSLKGIRSIEFGYDFKQSVDLLMSVFSAVITIFFLIACILAGAAIFTTIYVNFQERQREIATMLTLGLSDKEFMSIITIENLVQAHLGIFFGIPIGLWVASWLLDNILRLFYFEIFLKSTSYLILYLGVICVVLLSQIPAIFKGINLDLTVVTKELT